MRLQFVLCSMLLCSLPLSAAAESAEHAFKAGTRAEKKNDLDTAYQAYKRAHNSKPSDPKYMAAWVRLRFYAAAQHIHVGNELRDAKQLQQALAEFQIAAQIDPSSFAALGEIRRTVDEIQKEKRAKEEAGKARDREIEHDASTAAGPVALALKSNAPVSIHMTGNVDTIYKTISRLGGFNLLLDPDYKPQKITFELSDVTVREALNMLAIQSKTFWRPLSSNTILVTVDNTSKRKELQQSVMKTFYLRNASTPADLQQAAGTLKGILDISHIQATPELRSLTLRGTPDQIILAQKLLTDIDKPKSEVLIDVLVMEVSTDKVRTLGSVLPTTVSGSISPAGSSSGSGSGSSGLTLNSFANLGAGDISISLPGASFTALATDSATKVIQRPEVRVMDSERASLRIGDRIPIATGSFQSGLTQGVNTQFTYIDVGVNIDITPYIHANNEVTLKTSLEVSSVTGEQTIDGVTEPTIGQRRIDHQVRLADGEVNLIGGILEDSETRSLSGYPGIVNLPILKYLFGQGNKQHAKTEIVFAIIPHIVRSTEVTDENLKTVDLGSETSVTYRHADNSAPGAPLPAPAAPAPAAAQLADPRNKPIVRP